MEQFLATETLIIEPLLIVSLVALAVRRLRIPYTVALVVVGLLYNLSAAAGNRSDAGTYLIPFYSAACF